MGYFYHALTIRRFLEVHDVISLIVMNHDKVAEQILKSKNIPYETVDYSDGYS